MQVFCIINNMLKILKIISFSFNLFICIKVFSQNSLEIRNISTKQGLSSPRVLSIYQDFKGFIWIGTEYGLNCFDGYEFKIFRPLPSEGRVLKGNAIYTITENKKNELLVGTEKGVCKYNRKTGKFYEISLKNNNGQEIHNKIISIIQDKDHNYWLGLQHMGLLYCDSNFKKFKLYKFENLKNWERINNLFLLKEKILVATDNNGVLIFNPLTEKFYDFFVPAKFFKDIDNYVSSIFKDSQENLWFLLRKGAYKLPYPYLNKSNQNNIYLKNIELTDIKEDQDGNIWFASKDSGIFKLTSNKIIQYYNRNENSKIISSNYIVKIFFDRDNNMWLGTFDKGIDFSPYIKKPVNYISTTFFNNTITLSKASVLSICEDNEGNLWIGTDGGGLNFFDRKNYKIEVFKHNPSNKNSICGNNITFVFKDNKGNIWAAAYLKGLSKYNRNKKNFTNYSLVKNPNYTNIFNNDIRYIYEDKKGNFWIATNGGGIFYFDPNKGEIIKNFTAPYSNNDSLLISNYCLGILSDPKDSLLFIYSYNGLSIFDRYNSKFTNYWENKDIENNISSSEVYTAFLKDNILYLGTSSGLNIFNIPRKLFTSYVQNRNLPTDIINMIISDSRGKLWMSSYDHIIYFDPLTMYKKFYFISHFIPIEQFNHGAGCLTSKGEIVFGGTNGLIFFHPDSFKNNNKPPEIVFTNFKIFNEIIQPDSINSPLKENIEIAKEIKLKYNKNVISITFSALNYVYPEYNQYAFKLENYDKQWNYCGNMRTAVYTKLPPGKYTFRVIASNNDGIWNFKGSSIKITVLPPFYMTWWFKIFIFFSILLTPLAFYTYRLNLLQIKNKELEKKVNERTKELKDKNEELIKQTAKLNRINKLLKIKQEYIKEQSKILKLQKEQLEEANISKDKLFSIIAHDLKNPFSNVIGLSQVLESDYDELSEDERKLFLKNIRISTQNIFYLLENLLYWSRAQQKKITPHVTCFLIKELIEENINLFELSAKDKAINIEFISPNYEIYINSDYQLINSIIRNLLSNAIKFTPSGGNVKIILEDYSKVIKILISDTGKGLKKEEIDKLISGNHHTPTYGTNNEIGVGLGLNICKEFIKILKGELNAYPNEDKGVTFYFIIPKNINNNNYHNDKI